MDDTIESLRNQRSLLADTLGRLLVSIGMIRADTPLSGPELLLAAETAIDRQKQPMRDAEQYLSDLIDSIDACDAFVDLEAGQYRNGSVVQACRAINKPIPPNLATWFAENDMIGVDAEFKQWLDHLNVEAKNRGYADAATMWQDTGADAWRDYYDEGMSTNEALTEDEANGAS